MENQMIRTDIHRPSEITPEDYTFVAFSPVWRNNAEMGIMEQCAVIKEQREIISNHMTRTGGTWSHHQHAGSCHICGAWAIYTVVFYHAKTNTYIKTGADCADKLDMSYGDMNLFRKAIYSYREAKAGIQKAEKFLANNDLLRAWEIRDELAAHSLVMTARYLAEFKPNPSRDKEWESLRRASDARWSGAITIADIVSKLIKYGSISDAQVNLLRVKVQRHDNYEARQQKFAAEREAAAPCPKGRVKVSGTVLKVAAYDNQFGTTMKMTVKAQEGFMVFVSVPSSIPVPERGAVVSFVATIIPSDNDPKFGFGKRPVAA
jgi:hypothetical protein